MTGDLDLASPVPSELEEELVKLGFSKPVGPGHTPTGWVHPDFQLGIEVVTSTPFGGASDPARIALVDLEGAAFAILPVEDLIADRAGQFACGTAPEMLEQARTLSDLHPDLDRDYLEHRIRLRQWEIMGSTSSKPEDWQGRRFSHRDFAARLAARRAELGNPELPRNSGARRTASKRALLKAIEEAGGRW